MKNFSTEPEVIEDEDLDISFDDEPSTATYEVWILDEDSAFEKLIATFDNADTATTEAACYTLEDFGDIPCYVEQLTLQVEVVVQVDTDVHENVGSIFKKTFSVKKKQK